MSKSGALKQLAQQVGRLRRVFLPRRFDRLGCYAKPSRVQFCTRAYVVLCHAEIEAYLESRAREIVSAGQAAWTKSGRVTEPVACLLATLATRVPLPTKLPGPQGKDTRQLFGDAVAAALVRQYSAIKANHGVKEGNVLTLFAPLGVPSSAFGTTLVANLEAFGGLRGAHAHESARAVQSVLDPETEFRRIESLIQDLEPFDQWLTKYKRRVR